MVCLSLVVGNEEGLSVPGVCQKAGARREGMQGRDKRGGLACRGRGMYFVLFKNVRLHGTI